MKYDKNLSEDEIQRIKRFYAYKTQASVLNTLLYLMKNKLYTEEHPEYRRMAIHLYNSARYCHGIEIPALPEDQEDLVLTEDEMANLTKLRERLFNEGMD